MHRWQIDHINRGANAVAHLLARQTNKNIINEIWMEEIPHRICNIIVSLNQPQL